MLGISTVWIPGHKYCGKCKRYYRVTRRNRYLIPSQRGYDVMATCPCGATEKIGEQRNPRRNEYESNWYRKAH